MTERQHMSALRPGVRSLGSDAGSATRKRVPHILKSVKGECVPTRVIVFQVAPLRRRLGAKHYEDTLLCGHVRCYWLHDGEVLDEKGMDFGRSEQLWDFAHRHKARDRTTWVFAHSLGYQLTLLNYWRRLDAAGERHLWSVLSDPPTILCTKAGSSVVRYVDTVNYFREPLPRLLGGAVGWSSWVLDPGAPVYDHIAWCRRAAHALGGLLCRMIRLCRKELRCTWQSTAASLSWTVFRRWYNQRPIYIHAVEDALILERDALFGGLLSVSTLGYVATRTEAWDVNSLYPWVMATQPMPVKLETYYHAPTVRDLHAACDGYYCVADVAVDVPPYALPYREGARVGTRVSQGRYVLCGRELADALSLGMVYAVYRLATYHVDDPFSAFVYALYPRKLDATRQGDLAERWLWKMILNGLHGKFAQRYRRWRDAKEIFAAKRWGQWWHRTGVARAAVRARAIAGQTQLLEATGFRADALPVIAGAVASAGRSRIREIASLAGVSQCQYIDCDSVHIGVPGALSLAQAGVCDPGRLGAFKMVHDGPDAYYWGPKHYRIGTHYVSNIIHVGARKMEDGYWLQQSKRGLERTLTSGVLDRVLVREQEVRIDGA